MNSNGRSTEQQWAVQSVQLLLGIALISFCMSATCTAESKPLGEKPESKRLDPKALVGLKSSSKHELYPDGWKRTLADGYGSDGPSLSGLANKQTGQFAAVLIRLQDEGVFTKTRVWTVTDAIEINADANNHSRIARRCYFGVKPQEHSAPIVAEVRFRKRCDMTTNDIKVAWKVNTQTYRFEILNDLKGLTCEYGFVSAGAPDGRKGCSTYSPVE